MNTRKIKSTALALAVSAMATFGLASCNEGTEPGETNVERSGIREEGSMVGDEEGENSTLHSDTTDLEEKYYGDEDASNREGSAVHAGDGKGGGVERDDVE
jgi:hypothetical protein